MATLDTIGSIRPFLSDLMVSVQALGQLGFLHTVEVSAYSIDRTTRPGEMNITFKDWSMAASAVSFSHVDDIMGHVTPGGMVACRITHNEKTRRPHVYSNKIECFPRKGNSEYQVMSGHGYGMMSLMKCLSKQLRRRVKIGSEPSWVHGALFLYTMMCNQVVPRQKVTSQWVSLDEIWSWLRLYPWPAPVIRFETVCFAWQQHVNVLRRMMGGCYI